MTKVGVKNGIEAREFGGKEYYCYEGYGIELWNDWYVYIPTLRLIERELGVEFEADTYPKDPPEGYTEEQQHLWTIGADIASWLAKSNTPLWSSDDE